MPGSLVLKVGFVFGKADDERDQTPIGWPLGEILAIALVGSAYDQERAYPASWADRAKVNRWRLRPTKELLARQTSVNCVRPAGGDEQ
jgi:hypothetical protein